MSRSSPGRYAIHEFAKNVYSVRAKDGRGRDLRITRPDPYQWDVGGHNGTVTLSYTLYADHGDGTYAQIDSTHAHLNMPATFMWVRGMDARPIRVTFQPPANSGWKAATQLVPAGDPMTFTAPDLQYFMDSPTELSDHLVRTWTVTTGNRTDTIRLALHHTGTEAEADAYTEMAKKAV
jgi:predicted metalloprotease with PDZ domain